MMKRIRLALCGLTIMVVLLVWHLLTPLLPALSKTSVAIPLPSVCRTSLRSPQVSWQFPLDVEGELKQKNLNVAQRASNIFAWQTFIALNWPSLKGDRGMPDKTAPINANGPRVWETWKETSEVYLPQGELLPAWQTWRSQEDVPENVKVLFRQSKVDEILSDDFQPTKADGTRPGTLTDQRGNVVRYEIRMNRVLFDYVLKNKLYQADHQAHQAAIAVPDGSILIKAAWREVNPQEASRFYTSPAYVQDLRNPKQYSLKTMGLVGLHVMAKTPSAPQWIWSTFEQVDNVQDNNLHGNLQDTPRSGSLGDRSSFNNPNCTNCLTNQQTVPGIPNQVTRQIPIPSQDPDCNKPLAAVDNLQTLNHTLQKGLSHTIWQNYQLINTQWAIPKQPQDSTPNTVFEVLPPLLGNTTMETYIQKSSSCMGCHALARSTNPQKYIPSDFSFTFSDAFPKLSNPQIIPSPIRPLTPWENQNWNTILRGYQLTTQTYEILPNYVPIAKLHCASCHLNAGGNPKAASWLGMTEKYNYPATLDLQKRINLCFEHSLNGRPLPLSPDNPELNAFIVYMQWLDSQAETLNIAKPSSPYPPLTPLSGVAGRGKKIFEQKCAFCHNTNGQGRYDNETYYRPALWGKQSFNQLAGLAHPQKLAEFIHSNMPLDFGGNLTEQEAWDLAAFIDSQDRPLR